MSKVDKIRKISSLWREQTKALEKVELEGPTHLPQLGSEESRCKEGPWDGGSLSSQPSYAAISVLGSNL